VEEFVREVDVQHVVVVDDEIGAEDQRVAPVPGQHLGWTNRCVEGGDRDEHDGRARFKVGEVLAKALGRVFRGRIGPAHQRDDARRQRRQPRERGPELVEAALTPVRVAAREHDAFVDVGIFRLEGCPQAFLFLERLALGRGPELFEIRQGIDDLDCLAPREARTAKPSQQAGQGKQSTHPCPFRIVVLITRASVA
jgi:hypothetical protein